MYNTLFFRFNAVDMPDLVGSLVSSLNIQTVLVGLIVVLIVYKISQRIKYKQPPGPFALPLIGNYEGMLTNVVKISCN